MGEIAASSGSWRKGGTAITLEEHRRRGDIDAPKAPSGGTRLLERITVPDDNAWKEHAACKGKPTAWWFPEPGQYWSPDSLRARSICAECPAIDPCRETGLVRNEHGIWGETSGKARQAERRAAPKPEPSRRRKPKTKKAPHRPLAPLSQAIVAALANGHWCDLDEIVERVRHAVSEDQARRRQASVLRSKGRNVEPEQLGTAGLRAGQRQVVRDSLNTLQRRGFVEGVRGTWRLTETAAEQAVCV